MAIYCGANTSTPLKCVSSLDRGSSQSFVHGSTREYIAPTGAASVACKTFTQPRLWGSFGDATKPVTTQTPCASVCHFFSTQPALTALQSGHKLSPTEPLIMPRYCAEITTYGLYELTTRDHQYHHSPRIVGNSTLNTLVLSTAP